MAVTGPAGGTVFLKASPGISPYSQRTIACWVKMPPSGTTVNLFMGLVGSSFSYQFNLHYAGNPVPAIFGCVAQSQNGTSIDGTMATNASNGPWHFVLATLDNGGTAGQVQTIKIYYDGVLNNTVTTGGPVTALIDNDPGSSLYIWPGSADGGAQVAYPMTWKRLISQGEITALAAQGDPRTVASAQLVSFVALNQGTGTIPDLVGPGINWVVTGGTLTVVPDPFSLSMATTLSRYAFANPISGWINVKLVNPTGIAVGNTLTFTKPDGSTLTGVVQKLLPLGNVYLNVTASSKPSGQILLPKGTAVA